MKLKLESAVEAINLPAEKWTGRCYEIATALADTIYQGMGKPVYGLWLGPIAEGSYFEEQKPYGFSRHGWIRTDAGLIIDPTRWVFENADPYIYYGKNDFYDEGAIFLKTSRPMPEFNEANEKQLKFVFSVEKILFKSIFKSERVSLEQLLWLANIPPTELLHPNMVYDVLIRSGWEAFIPVDFLTMII